MVASSVLSRGFALIVLAVFLSGCNSWLSHRETISYQAGDAVAWNRAVHTVDPWPAASQDTTIPTSGRRIARVIDDYENGKQGEAGDLGGVAPAPIAIGGSAP